MCLVNHTGSAHIQHRQTKLNVRCSLDKVTDNYMWQLPYPTPTQAQKNSLQRSSLLKLQYAVVFHHYVENYILYSIFQGTIQCQPPFLLLCGRLLFPYSDSPFSFLREIIEATLYSIPFLSP